MSTGYTPCKPNIVRYPFVKTDFYTTPTSKQEVFIHREERYNEATKEHDTFMTSYAITGFENEMSLDRFLKLGFTKYGDGVPKECSLYLDETRLGVVWNYHVASIFMDALIQSERNKNLGVNKDVIKVYSIRCEEWGTVYNRVLKYDTAGLLTAESDSVPEAYKLAKDKRKSSALATAASKVSPNNRRDAYDLEDNYRCYDGFCG